MVGSMAAWLAGPVGIKLVKDAGGSQYRRYWRVRGRRSSADHPAASATRGRGTDHLLGLLLEHRGHGLVDERVGDVEHRLERRHRDPLGRLVIALGPVGDVGAGEAVRLERIRVRAAARDDLARLVAAGL